VVAVDKFFSELQFTDEQTVKRQILRMRDKLQQNIDGFISYFKKQLDEIKALQTEHAELYRKLLYVSVLDSLAGSVFPRRRNRDRYIDFLQRFCSWPDGNRVSLPHLVQLLRKNPDPAFQNLREWTLAKFKVLPVHGGSLMPITHDPLFDEVKREWPVSKEHRTPLEGIDLVALRHFQLLYVYRNSLVHELRTPGYGMEFGNNDKYPFYHGMSTVGKDGAFIGTTIELVYPWRFLHFLCETALDQLNQYCLSNELNPYDSFVFGTYWIRDLNR
jgi:hypothetical protein